MKRITTNLCTLLLLVFSLLACNQPATTSEKNEKDTSVVGENKTADMPPYDPAMDPWNIGGQGMKKIKDTLGLKMYEFTAKPGESWALHTHPDHLVYVLEGSTIELFIKEVGKLDTLTFPTGMGLISAPISDSGRNIGNTTIRMLVADIYRPRSN
jgi:hypothetical protein